MNPLLFLGIAAAGGLGAVARLVVDGAIRARWATRFPWGTTVINVTGSFLLGLVTGLAVAHVLDDSWKLVIGTGLLGGYTTFSTASVETVRLLRDGRLRAGLANGLGMLVGAVVASALGMLLGLAAS
ncbi:fluoride efflux transporter CrcB [Plantibacter sp. YIM 135347]|uniref:fluoride efflux transporter CrcB n=1 Tax=Plantibacter sp. YIM 135347 TaxID=3423919 RepID=UPI003D32B382